MQASSSVALWVFCSLDVAKLVSVWVCSIKMDDMTAPQKWGWSCDWSSMCIDGTSLAWLHLTTAKRRLRIQMCKKVAFLSRLLWLDFWIVGGSGHTLSSFINSICSTAVLSKWAWEESTGCSHSVASGHWPVYRRPAEQWFWSAAKRCFIVWWLWLDDETAEQIH